MSDVATKILYVVGDATAPGGDGPKVIAHVCNDVGAWGAGFTGAISRKWANPEKRYRTIFKMAPLELGTVQYADVGLGVVVANMIAQRGLAGVAIRYGALERCLTHLREYALLAGASVHMPRIGCGLAGGKWTEVEPLVKKALTDKGVVVTVYDLGVKP
jgi:O-acetyl-ADP-ribose deacetylase (regulator of RNase III)